MPDVLFEINDVSLAGDPRARLEGVSLRVRAGVTALLGPSGAGKTSLLNLLVGFEKPDRGTIVSHIARNDPSNSSRNGSAAHALPVFWSPQNDGLWPHLSAREHLQAVLPRGKPGKVATGNAAGSAAVDEMLERFDLTHRAHAWPDELSQGERSRLAVARALLADPALLVMDEPLAHVDPDRVGKYWDAIDDLLAVRKTSLIFSTHMPAIALAHAQHAAVLDAGRLLYDGPIDELYHNPATPELARCLGEANWLTPREAGLWLGEAASAGDGPPRCYRPERLAVEPSEASPIVVRAARFAGSVAQVDLEHEATRETRRFFHRPAGRGAINSAGTATTPAPGMRVVLRLCTAGLLALLTLLSLLTAGCSRSDEPVIQVKGEKHWSVPSEGLGVPRPRKMTMGNRGEVIVLDTAARILVYNPDGSLNRQWKMPLSQAGNPEGALLLKDGRIAVCDTHYYRVMFFDEQGKILGSFGENGKGDGQFVFPVTICQDDRENLYVCEYGGNDRVQKFTREGKFICSFGSCGTGPGQLQRPSGLVWHKGRVYVADAINNRIQVFTDEGKFVTVLGGAERPLDLRFPYDLALAPDETFYVVEWGAGRLTHITLDGKVLGRVGSPGTGMTQFRTPWGLAIDKQMHVRVADTENRRIVELQL
ncbi:MAG: ATP-binding cassette domain-containing protein [Planctomycetota bacterium]|nr:ATP-binding cassette domain-containing protein [Planctomycetota bacterium]